MSNEMKASPAFTVNGSEQAFQSYMSSKTAIDKNEGVNAFEAMGVNLSKLTAKKYQNTRETLNLHFQQAVVDIVGWDVYSLIEQKAMELACIAEFAKLNGSAQREALQDYIEDEVEVEDDEVEDIEPEVKTSKTEVSLYNDKPEALTQKFTREEVIDIVMDQGGLGDAENMVDDAVDDGEFEGWEYNDIVDRIFNEIIDNEMHEPGIYTKYYNIHGK